MYIPEKPAPTMTTSQRRVSAPAPVLDSVAPRRMRGVYLPGTGFLTDDARLRPTFPRDGARCGRSGAQIVTIAVPPCQGSANAMNEATLAFHLAGHLAGVAAGRLGQSPESAA